MPSPRTLLQRTFDIRRGEGLRASLMFLYIFIIISSLMIVKPVATSLFLSKFGAEQLPYAFILVALSAGLVTSFYLRLMKRGRLKSVITRTLQFFVLCLFGFWWLLNFRLFEEWALYLFYIWVAIFAVVATSQFWTLANIIFNAREAKRLFGFIGAGAIAGGIFGGYLTKFLAPVLGSVNLLFLCMASLAFCIPITQLVWNKARDKDDDFLDTQKKTERIVEQPIKLMRKSRHVTYLAGIVGIGVVVAKLVDYQYSAIASQAITDNDELTAFFGFWLSNFNIASLLIQLFFTRHIVKLFGVGNALYFLPFGIMLGAFATLLNPKLWSAILIKISDGSLKQSVHKAGLELLTLPIPSDIKKQAKALIDVFVDSFATGIGGVLLIVLTLGFGFSASMISAVIIPMILIWFLMIGKVRREYVNSFRYKLESSKDSQFATLERLKRGTLYKGLLKVLQGGNEKKILYVLRMLRDTQNNIFVPNLIELLHHPSSAVRLEVLKNIYYYKHLDFRLDVKQLIHDSDQDVKTEAIHYLFQHANGNGVGLIRSYLSHPDHSIRAAALLCAARESKDNKKLKKTFQIRQLVEERLQSLPEIRDKQRSKFTKINCARIIGAANIPELYPHLHALLKDHGAEVLKAAITSAGQTGNREFIPIIFQYLQDENLQEFAAEALTSFGPEIIELLVYFMNSRNEDRNVRLRIPEVISNFGVQKAVDTLLQNIDHHNIDIRNEIVKALNCMKTDYPDLVFDERKVVKRILNEARTYRTMLAALYAQVKAENELDGHMAEVSNLVQIKLARQNLIDALEARLDDNLERIFKLLGLKYAPSEIEVAFKGIRSNRPDIRANAIEFLDNLLESNLKKAIIPIVETTLVETLMEESLKRMGFKTHTETDSLVQILTGEDNYLKECSLKLISELREDRYDRFIFKLLKDPDSKIKKMAWTALHKIGLPMLDFGHKHARV